GIVVGRLGIIELDVADAQFDDDGESRRLSVAVGERELLPCTHDSSVARTHIRSHHGYLRARPHGHLRSPGSVSSCERRGPDNGGADSDAPDYDSDGDAPGGPTGARGRLRIIGLADDP